MLNFENMNLWPAVLMSENFFLAGWNNSSVDFRRQPTVILALDQTQEVEGGKFRWRKYGQLL